MYCIYQFQGYFDLLPIERFNNLEQLQIPQWCPPSHQGWEAQLNCEVLQGWACYNLSFSHRTDSSVWRKKKTAQGCICGSQYRRHIWLETLSDGEIQVGLRRWPSTQRLVSIGQFEVLRGLRVELLFWLNVFMSKCDGKLGLKQTISYLNVHPLVTANYL